MLYVLLTFGKTQKDYYLIRMNYYIESSLEKPGKISREH